MWLILALNQEIQIAFMFITEGNANCGTSNATMLFKKLNLYLYGCESSLCFQEEKSYYFSISTF